MKSLNVAIKLNIKHKNIIQHINKNIELFNEFGKLEKLKGITTDKGGRPDIYYDLNNSHIKFLITLIKNDDIIRKIKQEIILNKFNIDEFKKEPIKGYVYIIKNTNGYKIGSSIDYKKRIRAIETQQGCKVELILVSDKRYDYNVKEIELHNLYKKNRLFGEYFDLSSNDLTNITCNLYETSPNNLKFSVSKLLYDNDKAAFYDLYLIDLGKAINKENTQLYILDSTIYFAKKIITENNNDVGKAYKILKNEIPKIVELIYSNS